MGLTQQCEASPLLLKDKFACSTEQVNYPNNVTVSSAQLQQLSPYSVELITTPWFSGRLRENALADTAGA